MTKYFVFCDGDGYIDYTAYCSDDDNDVELAPPETGCTQYQVEFDCLECEEEYDRIDLVTGQKENGCYDLLIKE